MSTREVLETNRHWGLGLHRGPDEEVRPLEKSLLCPLRSRGGEASAPPRYQVPGLRGPQSHSRSAREHKSLGGGRGEPGPVSPAPWAGVFQRSCAHRDASGPGPNRVPRPPASVTRCLGNWVGPGRRGLQPSGPAPGRAAAARLSGQALLATEPGSTCCCCCRPRSPRRLRRWDPSLETPHPRRLPSAPSPRAETAAMGAGEAVARRRGARPPPGGNLPRPRARGGGRGRDSLSTCARSEWGGGRLWLWR